MTGIGGREGKRERGERLGVEQKLKESNPSFELGPRPRTRVQNSDQTIRTKVHTFLIIFIYLFLLFTKKNLQTAAPEPLTIISSSVQTSSGPRTDNDNNSDFSTQLLPYMRTPHKHQSYQQPTDNHSVDVVFDLNGKHPVLIVRSGPSGVL
jgi:hypothetical protein